MYFLVSEASRYLCKQGIILSSSGLRKAVLVGEVKAIQTVGGARIFSKNDLDDFIAKRRAKKQNTLPVKQLDAA